VELSASRAAKGRPRVGREATDCATARLFACASRRSTLNNSSRIGCSLSHGDAFRENPSRRRVVIRGSAVKPRFDNVRLRGTGSRGEAHRGAGNDWDFFNGRRTRPGRHNRRLGRRQPGARSFSHRPRFGEVLPNASGRKDHTHLLAANGALGNYLRREPPSGTAAGPNRANAPGG
jgi:hypothetical protein